MARISQIKVSSDEVYDISLPNLTASVNELNFVGGVTSNIQQQFNNITGTHETKTDASAKLTEAKTYTDTKVAALVNSAPETLDTLGELATALQENEEVVDALNAAIGNKADKNAVEANENAISSLQTQLSGITAATINRWEVAD